MTDPIVEHAKATLEIVDLLQMMVAECKCQAWHVLHDSQEPSGPCSVTVVARSKHCARDWFLVCEEYVGYYKFCMEDWPNDWFCRECKKNCWSLMPV